MEKKKKNLSCASMRKRQGVKEETSVRITMQQNQPIRNRIQYKGIKITAI